MKMTYRIKSDRGLARALNKIPSEMSREVADVVQGHAQALAVDMRARVPVDTGILRESIRVRKAGRGLFARVGSFSTRKMKRQRGRFYVFYARFIEFGFTDRSGKKVPARPFIFNAWRARRYNVKIDILEKARDVLRRNAASGQMTDVKRG